MRSSEQQLPVPVAMPDRHRAAHTTAGGEDETRVPPRHRWTVGRMVRSAAESEPPRESHGGRPAAPHGGWPGRASRTAARRLVGPRRRASTRRRCRGRGRALTRIVWTSSINSGDEPQGGQSSVGEAGRDVHSAARGRRPGPPDPWSRPAAVTGSPRATRRSETATRLERSGRDQFAANQMPRRPNRIGPPARPSTLRSRRRAAATPPVYGPRAMMRAGDAASVLRKSGTATMAMARTLLVGFNVPPRRRTTGRARASCGHRPSAMGSTRSASAVTNAGRG